MWFDEAPKKNSRKKKSSRKKPQRRKSTGKRGAILEVKARANEQRVERNHRIATVTLVLAVVIGGSLLAVMATRSLGGLLYWENGQYTLQRIQVDNPGGKLRKDHVTEYAGVEIGDNLFGLDLEGILSDLESTPRIRRVTLRRRLPDTLHVSVVERTAIARLDPVWAVDVEGVVLGPDQRSTFLPSISGIRTPGMRPGSKVQDEACREALHMLDLCDSTQLSRFIKIKSVNLADPERLDIVLQGGERVIMARTNMEGRLNRLVSTLSKAERLGKQLATIDLTVEGKNVPVTYR